MAWSFSRVSKSARGETRPGDGSVKWKTAGDSGGVTGSDVAVGDGSASILERKRARRSTVGNFSTSVKSDEIGEVDRTIKRQCRESRGAVWTWWLP